MLFCSFLKVVLPFIFFMDRKKIVGYWLLVGVMMLIVQVLLGGITRLTGSGLSITEWKPILGSIPPLTEHDWQKAFLLYQQKTGQFKYLNQDFTLSNFKFIYFWEWMHRNWARFISVVFLIPFIFFIVKKYFTQSMISKLVALFVLGAAQGLIGWIMVKSGLNDDNLYVSHIRLAIHFISALVLIGFTLWFALSLLIDETHFIFNNSLKWLTAGIILILFAQLTYGAFMAGMKAATVAPTWPSINGDYFPESIWKQSFLHSAINIHFVHRMLAYIILILVGIWFVKASSIKDYPLLSKYRFLPVLLVAVQIVLGILCLVTATMQVRNGFGVFEYLAQAHQLVAMFLLMSMLFMLFLFKGGSKV
jgi:cytochrome c oxidase assembly protein subunit 15